MTEQILKLAQKLPEGDSLSAKALLHLGNRAAVDQALSRLVRRGKLMRAGRGIYVRPVQGKFGTRPPSAATLVRTLSTQRGETIAPHGAAVANALGLTTQVPAREVYLTSGRSRQLRLGAQTVELRHAPSWQLLLPQRRAGEALRALAAAHRRSAQGSVQLADCGHPRRRAIADRKRQRADPRGACRRLG